jgi:hypothetical protein
VTLEEELEHAWEGMDPPSPDGITAHVCPECEEVAGYFGGRRWQELVNADELRYHECALSLFTPQAFHYYLPAFIRATLRDPKGADVIPDGITFAFESELGAASRERLPLFTAAQRQSVARFLRELVTLRLTDEEQIEPLAQVLES